MTIAAGQVARAADVAVLAGILPGTCVARLRRTSATTIPQGAAIPWDAEDLDTLDAHAANTTRFQPTIAGRYLVHAVVRHQVVTAGAAIFATITRNGVAQASVVASANSSPSAGVGVAVVDVVSLNGSSDYLEVTVGNNQSVNVNASGSVVTIIYAGA